jgi:hypothetical protein
MWDYDAEGRGRERLLDKTGFAGRQAAMDYGLVRVTGHEEHLHRPTARRQAGCQLADGDPRAACVLYNQDESFPIYYRLPYDVRKAQEKIRRAGLPPLLADRLGSGR